MNLINSLQKKIKRARLVLGNNEVLDSAEEEKIFAEFEEALAEAILSQVDDIVQDEMFFNDLINMASKAEVNRNIVAVLSTKFIPISEKLKTGFVLSFLVFSANIGGQQALDELNITAFPFELENEDITRRLQNRALSLVTIIDETTKKDISRMIEQGRAGLLTNEEIATLISDKFINISKTRAHIIARNELATVVNEVAFETFVRNGVVKVRWVTVLDERVCPICMPLHNQVVAIGTSFVGTNEVKGQEQIVFTGPKPPAHVLCRCFLEEVIEGFEVRDDTIVFTGA